MSLKKKKFRRSQRADPTARVRPIFDDFHLLTMDGDFEYPRHQHTNYEVILVERGPYRCELNRRELTLDKGQILLIKPGDWHQDHLRHRQRHYVLHFRILNSEPGIAPVELFDGSVLPEMQVCRGDYLRDAFFLRELEKEAIGQGVFADAVQDCLLEALFWRIVRGLPPKALSLNLRQLPIKERERDQIAAVFSRFVAKQAEVSEIAAAVGVSPRHLAYLCRSLFGQSPARLLLHLKMRRADELLRHRGFRVRAVSDELGFANPYHFSRVYRRLRGHPPTHSPGRPRTERAP